MSRLPLLGGDENVWGSILNDFLAVEHSADGTLKIRTDPALTGKAADSAVVHNTGAETIAGDKTFQSSPLIPGPTLGSHATTKAYVDSAVVAGAADATTSSKGIIQLAGDLAGTATAPTVPGLNTVAIDNQTGTTYTFVLADAGKVVEANNIAAVTLTVPPNSSIAFSIGTIIEVWQQGVGQVTIAPGAGVTILCPTPTLQARTRYATLSLRKRATDEWVLSGDLA